MTQVSEVDNSNQMEKKGFIKSLKTIKDEGLIPKQITTDRHTQIRKHMREKEPDISHQFDVWHFVKNIKKKDSCCQQEGILQNTRKWVKSIGNHLWWACATCDGDAELLREKWISVLFSHSEKT